MRLMLTATVLLAMSGPSAFAQTAPAAKPKPAATEAARPKPAAAAEPAKPATQTPMDTAGAMTPAERMALQSDLAWVGEYNGAITGDVSERMVNAIKQYQKLKGGKQTGVLNPQERSALADTARRRQENVGWKVMTEPTTGARVGIPTKLVPQQTTDANGSKWSSPTGTVQVLLSRRKEAGATSAKLAEREKKEPAERKVDYSVVKPDFFVLSGLQGLKKFYVRGTHKGDEVRVLTILYDQATENTVEPVVIAMSSAFAGFPTGALAGGPPPRRNVDYGTGVVVSSDGAIVTDREIVDGCLTITVAGHGPADRVAEDKERGIALLRIYGAQNLKPLSLAGSGAPANVELTGIADPQNQGGGAAVTSMRAVVSSSGGSEMALSPAPAIGFSGAAALEGPGKFAGIALLKPAIVAGAAGAAPSTQAALVPAETVRGFLKTHGVTGQGSSTDAKAAAVRVICVRK